MNRRSFVKIAASIAAGSFIFGKELFADSIKDPLNKPEPANWKNDEINIAWIGHATILINFYGKIILTDPVLFSQVGIPFFEYKFGPKRAVMPALDLDEIPKPDLILISHAHMDHMDYETLKAITKKFPDSINCITAASTKDVVEDLKWKSLIELDWNDEIIVDEIKLKGIEVVHNGWRYPGEKDRSTGNIEGRSYNGYIIEYNNKKIFFGGDTAFTEKFKNLKNEKIDIVILPSVSNESFGMILVEAMRSGKPIICSNFGGMKEVLINNYNGFFFDSGNPVSLYIQIKRFLSNKKLINKFGNNGYKRFLKLFTSEIMCENYQRIIK